MATDDIYQEHARLLLQMARHIELSNRPEFKFVHGNRTAVSTSDDALVATILNSIYGFPTGANAARKLGGGILSGQSRRTTLLDIVSIEIECSELDSSVTYYFRPFPSKEPQTIKLLRDAAEYSTRRADAYTRTLAQPSRNLFQLER